jgi:hypothetical protein
VPGCPELYATDLAQKQAGVVSATQALSAGMTRRGISWLCGTGAWRALAAGTYLVGAAAYSSTWAELPFEPRLSTARLVHGPDALAVLDTAAQVHGLEGLPYGDGTIHLARGPGQERPSNPAYVCTPGGSTAATRP